MLLASSLVDKTATPMPRIYFHLLIAKLVPSLLCAEQSSGEASDIASLVNRVITIASPESGVPEGGQTLAKEFRKPSRTQGQVDWALMTLEERAIPYLLADFEAADPELERCENRTMVHPAGLSLEMWVTQKDQLVVACESGTVVFFKPKELEYYSKSPKPAAPTPGPE